MQMSCVLLSCLVALSLLLLVDAGGRDKSVMRTEKREQRQQRKSQRQDRKQDKKEDNKNMRQKIYNQYCQKTAADGALVTQVCDLDFECEEPRRHKSSGIRVCYPKNCTADSDCTALSGGECKNYGKSRKGCRYSQGQKKDDKSVRQYVSACRVLNGAIGDEDKTLNKSRDCLDGACSEEVEEITLDGQTLTVSMCPPLDINRGSRTGGAAGGKRGKKANKGKKGRGQGKGRGRGEGRGGGAGKRGRKNKNGGNDDDDTVATQQKVRGRKGNRQPGGKNSK